MFISSISSIFELKVFQLKVLNLLHFIMSSLFYILVWPIFIIFGILLIASVFFPWVFVVSFSFKVTFISLHFTFFHLRFYSFSFSFHVFPFHCHFFVLILLDLFFAILYDEVINICVVDPFHTSFLQVC